MEASDQLLLEMSENQKRLGKSLNKFYCLSRKTVKSDIDYQ
jgi:hypothetical protein